MAFTREAVFLKFLYSAGTPASAFAFYAVKDAYEGGGKIKSVSLARSQYDNRLLITRAATKPRQFNAIVWGLDSPTGTANDGVDDIPFGSVDQLEAAWGATDLRMKSFEDDEYWECEWLGDWTVILEFDPFRNYSLVKMTLEGKA